MNPLNIPALVDSAKPAVQIENGKVITSSLEVARVFGKRHDNVIRDIQNLLSQLDADHLLNFEETVETRENPSGGAPIKSPAYRLTRDGFTLLTMGFTGKRALAFKLAYIDAFNAMEAQLKGKAMLPAPVPTRTLTFTVPLNDRTSRWLLNIDRQGREVVTELSPETHVIDADQWIQRLMEAPADLNLTLSQMLTIVHACMNAMRTSVGTYASALKIQPAAPLRGTRRQFSSIGIPGASGTA